MTTKQFILLIIMYLATALLSLLLLEGPIVYIFGMQITWVSISNILLKIIGTFSISFTITATVLAFLCFILLDKQLEDYKAVLLGGSTTLSEDQKFQGLKRMKIIHINAVILGITPIINYILLTDIDEIFSLEVIQLNIVLINLLFGVIIAILYADISHIIFLPVCRAFQVPLQGQARSVASTTVRMAVTAIASSLLVLLFSHIFFDVKKTIYSQIISSISTSLGEQDEFLNVKYEIQSIYEEFAAKYPLSLNLTWEDIDFSDHFEHLVSELNSDSHDDTGAILKNLQDSFYMVVFFLIFTSLSSLSIFLLCQQYKIRINDVFLRVRGLLRGEEAFAGIVPLTSFDEVGYFVGYLNLLTMTSQRISRDVQGEGKNLLGSLETQNNNIQQLSNIVDGLAENTAQINESVSKEEEDHKVINESLDNVRKIIFKVNSLLNNQRKYVDVIANQVNTFASLVDNVKQITEKADREAGVLTMSVLRGEEAVESSIIGMKEISEASEAIENIVGAITKIAAQTSLLSMNAAIEAAHAGEYGSGFAVLAQEVRSLSESASAQSRSIREQIESLISGVESGLGISENTTSILGEISGAIEQNNIFVKNIIDAMAEQHQGSRSIVQLIESSVSRGSKIRSLTDKQIRKSQEVMTSMLGFLQTSAAIVEQSKDSSNSIQSISSHVQGIKESVSKNEEIAKKVIEDAMTIEQVKRSE